MSTTAPVTQDDLANPPQDVLDALAVLGRGLKESIPTRRPDNLLVGTWNIRAFGGATARFEPGPKDNPKRNYADICALAEVVRRFDVVAIQETREDLTALKAMMRRLGDHWTFVVTDVGLGGAANGEAGQRG